MSKAFQFPGDDNV